MRYVIKIVAFISGMVAVYLEGEHCGGVGLESGLELGIHLGPEEFEMPI